MWHPFESAETDFQAFTQYLSIFLVSPLHHVYDHTTVKHKLFSCHTHTLNVLGLKSCMTETRFPVCVTANVSLNLSVVKRYKTQWELLPSARGYYEAAQFTGQVDTILFTNLNNDFSYSLLKINMSLLLLQCWKIIWRCPFFQI